jgi:hypothetical protein
MNDLVQACRNHPHHHDGLLALLDWACPLLTCTHSLEVGVYAGESTELIAPRFTRHYAVDAWTDESIASMKALGFSASLADIERSFDARAAALGNVIKFKGTSLYISGVFEPESMDFLYIDAEHDEASVRSDITLWLPALRRTRPSVIAGHDYVEQHSGVIRAVNSIFEPSAIHTFIDGSWAVAYPHSHRRLS